MNRNLPPWLTKRIPSPAVVAEVDRMVRVASLHTVCESARCPNLGECWSRRIATFMILGETCTRNCGFCAVKVGRPEPPDQGEPRRVAETAAKMDLRHVVVTSVTRDDLPDRGAGQFIQTIRCVRELLPDTTVEVLTPDFLGDAGLIALVVQERPDIFNHNLETVERLSPTVRPQARYRRSLDVLRLAKEANGDVISKSGIMVGLGETLDEVRAAMRDIRAAGVEVLTIGQYLRPTLKHLPVVEFVTPEVFAELEQDGLAMGFRYVASSPFTRSSYNADLVLAGGAETDRADMAP
jgi:lipoic acid synthetase